MNCSLVTGKGCQKKKRRSMIERLLLVAFPTRSACAKQNVRLSHISISLKTSADGYLPLPAAVLALKVKCRSPSRSNAIACPQLH